MLTSSLDILTVPQGRDNYAYVLRCPQTGTCAVVDPSDAGPVLETLYRVGGRVSFILNTHFHEDHTGANRKLQEHTGCAVLGSEKDARRIAGLSMGLKDGDPIMVGNGRGVVLETPGHTCADVSFWFDKPGAVFSGDCLFSMGCGRLFEGTADDMWASLKRLRDLPGKTLLYPGHEYTLANIAFVRTIDPDNTVLQDVERSARAAVSAGKPTIPSLMENERAANPFLRADDPFIQRQVRMEGAKPEAVFAEIRARRDRFTL